MISVKFSHANQWTICPAIKQIIVLLHFSLWNMKIFTDFSLKGYNTFGIDIKCRRFIAIENESEAQGVILNHLQEQPFYVLGGGSNVLFIKDFDGTIVHMQTVGIDMLQEDDDSVWLSAAAGETWEQFVNYCVSRGYYGVENLIGIPGLVGSCPVQNIGAYGVEVKDVIERVEGFSLIDAKSFVMSHDECGFAYRNSIFKNELKNRCLITRVVFRLSKKEKYNLTYKALSEKLQYTDLTLSKVAETVLSIRKSKLPDVTELGSAGSFFKNPVVSQNTLENLLQRFPELVHYPAEGGAKLAAGQLIDLCQWKGRREGNVGTYPLQALVIVNYGGATGREIVDFYTRIQAAVFDVFGVCIEPEVNVV